MKHETYSDAIRDAAALIDTIAVSKTVRNWPERVLLQNIANEVRRKANNHAFKPCNEKVHEGQTSLWLEERTESEGSQTGYCHNDEREAQREKGGEALEQSITVLKHWIEANRETWMRKTPVYEAIKILVGFT